MLQQTIDFTKGNIIRNLIAFSIPIVLGELLQNLYNSVDALVVGNFVDQTALAAVTICNLISTVIINFFNGMSVGTNVVVSHEFGAGDNLRLKHTIRVTFSFSCILGFVLSLLGIVLAPNLLSVAGALPEYYQSALIYLQIYLAGLAFTVIYNSGAGILRATGDSSTPFYILLFTCVFNVLLDVLFVAVFHAGIAGAGFATILSQLLSAVFVYLAINKSQQMNSFSLRELRSGKAIILSVLDVGMAAGMQSALIGFSNLFVARYMNMFDTASVAGIGIAQRLDKFVVLPAKTFGITVTTFISQNLGAKKTNRIKTGTLKCMILAVTVTASLSAFVYMFSTQLSALFNPDTTVISVSSAMMRVFLPLMFLVAIREILLGVLRGYRKTLTPMVLSLLGMVVFRQAFLYFSMRQNVNIANIYYCYPVAWVITLFLLVVYFLAVRKELPGFEKNPARRI